MKTIYFVNYSTAAYPIDRLTHCKLFHKLRDAREFARANAGKYEIIRQHWLNNWNAENKTIEVRK